MMAALFINSHGKDDEQALRMTIGNFNSYSFFPSLFVFPFLFVVFFLFKRYTTEKAIQHKTKITLIAYSHGRPLNTFCIYNTLLAG